MTRPTLAVLLPNYNHAGLLSRSLDAILEQSGDLDELWVIDDCSSDASWDLIRSYASRDPSVRAVRHETNLGITASVEEVLAQSACDYLYVAAADDRVLGGFFGSAMDLAARCPQAGLIMAPFVAVTPEGHEVLKYEASSWKESRYVAPHEFMAGYLEKESPMHSLCTATIYKASALREFGVRRFAALGHWWDSFLVRAIGLKYGIGYLAKEGTAWTIMPGGMSQSGIGERKKLEDLGDRIAAWMRKPEFAESFPEAFTVRWHLRQRRFARLSTHPMFIRSLRLYRRLIRTSWLRGPCLAVANRLRRRCL